MSDKYKVIIAVFLFFLGVFANNVSAANQNNNEINAHQEDAAAHHEEEFNAGTMIIDHILDAHEWHILSIGDKHVSIYLPVILYDAGKFYVFSSKNFHHGHQAYKGFKLEKKGKNKGKIVKLEDGSKPLDLSITKNTLAMFISIILIFLIFLSMAKRYKKYPNTPPKGLLQLMLEPLIIFVRDDIAKSAIGEHKYEKFTPYLLSVFFFIFFNNLIGLIPVFPGGANLTGNITVTLTLALFTFFITQFLGNKNYWGHIFNTPGVPWYMKFPIPLMPIIEIIGMVTKPFVLMVRLFANITAGHIIVLGFISLIIILGQVSAGLGYGISVISVPLAIFMTFVELLVAFIQAFVFTLLTALYFSAAVEEAHH